MKEGRKYTEDASEEFPVWAGPCGSDDAPPKLGQCKKVPAAWAIGAGPFTYPKVWVIEWPKAYYFGNAIYI